MDMLKKRFIDMLRGGHIINPGCLGILFTLSVLFTSIEVKQQKIKLSWCD